MKRRLSLFVSACVAFAFVSCHKAERDMQDYFVKVKTVSAEVQADGTVLVTGEIESEGDAKPEFAGFCCSTSSVPTLLSRQQSVTTISGNRFTSVYSGFSVDSTYYFRSWASNDFGYSYGNVIALDSIAATPVTAPCTLTPNTITLGTTFPGTEPYTSISTPSNNMGVWEVQAQSNSTSIFYEFGSAINTGIYTTTTNTTPGPGQVYAYFYSGSIFGALASGTPVYVNPVSAGHYEVTVCSAPWTFSSTTLYFKTRFVVVP